MKRFALLACVLVLSSSGCAGRYYWHSHTHYGYSAYPTAPAQVVVTQPPPALPVVTELRPPQPSGNSTWIEGHWTYNGMWAWVDGTWVTGYGGWVWTPPVIVVVDGYYVLHRGYFRQPMYAPAPAYVHPNRIHISVGTTVVNHTHPHPQPPQPQAGYQPRPAAPEPPLERPRQLEVPGAVVRTPPAPSPARPEPPRATTEPERPVLVAPGATVSRRPIQRAPEEVAAPVSTTPAPAPNEPPVLSNVPPVVERLERDPGKQPRETTVAPAPQIVTEAPKAPRPIAAPTPPPSRPPAPIHAPAPAPIPPPAPTQVAPSGYASRGAGRARAEASTPPQQAQSVGRSREPNRVPNATQAAPDRRAQQAAARPERSSTSAFSNLQARTREANQAQPAPTRPAPSTTRERTKASNSTVVQPSGSASREVRRSRKEPEAKPAPKPSTMTCSLLANEAPRGGQLDLHGEGFGATPVVRIGGKVTRILRRNATDIRVQIPRDSNGGSVTVHAGSESTECGTLTIIGTDR